MNTVNQLREELKTMTLTSIVFNVNNFKNVVFLINYYRWSINYLHNDRMDKKSTHAGNSYQSTRRIVTQIVIYSSSS